MFLAAGLHRFSDTVQIAPAWTLPSNLVLHLSGLPVGDHLVDLAISREAVLLHRQDQLSAPLFVQQGARGSPRALGVGERQHLAAAPIYLTAEATGQLSVSPQQELQSFGARPHPTRWSTSFIVSMFLVLVVAVFHVLLIRMVYNEYCRKS